ncbi:cyclic 3',5'-adenosine monophosphate phosphodiesterase [Chlamydia abortus]|nr:cyclic 3',5'-adenosine monophosphate phosphodiesterase [Chlamydia abortus]
MIKQRMNKRVLLLMLLCCLAVPGANAAASPSSTSAVEAAEARLSFFVLSDIHVQSWDMDSKRKFKSALEDLHRINADADALIINGDLGNGAPADYEEIKHILNRTPHPHKILFSIGNHEFYQAWINRWGRWDQAGFPNGERDQSSISRFLSFAERDKVYEDYWIKGFHFIVLGSEKYRQSDPDVKEDAYLSSEQLQWLSDKLAEGAESGRPIFVFLHQPLPGTVSGSEERGVVQHNSLKRLLQRYPQVVLFTGHTHWELSHRGMFRRDGFWMVNSSSVYEPWKDNNRPAGKGRSEGLYIEVNGSTVKIRGRDLSESKWIPEAGYIFNTGLKKG